MTRGSGLVKVIVVVVWATAHDPHLRIELRQPQRHRAAVFFDHQGRWDRLGGNDGTEQQEEDNPDVRLHGRPDH